MAVTSKSIRALASGRADPSRVAGTTAPTISYGTTTLTMTAADASTPNCGDANTDLVIVANRTRIAEVVADIISIDARTTVIEVDVTALASIVAEIRAACVRVGLLIS